MSDLLLEYDTSKLASVLLEEYVQSESLYYESLYNQIIGAGIYDEAGELVRGSGQVPAKITLPPPTTTDTHFEYDRQSGTVSLLRPVGISSLINDRMRRPMDRMRQMDRPYSFLVIVDAKSFYRTRRWYTAGMVASPIAIAALITFFGFYYLRARRYQRATNERERLARLGETARTLAHEIKNPLNAINLRTRVLKHSVPADSAEDVEAIEYEVMRLKRLTDRIGDFLRDPVGQPTEVDLLEAVHATITRHRWPVDVATFGNEHYRIRFDELRLGSVLENLIGNALEAQQESTTQERVTVGLRNEGGWVICEVTDHGPGMSKEAIERAFDPFFTTKASGSGIGLSIAKRFIESSGGQIGISTHDSGTTVRMRLQGAS